MAELHVYDFDNTLFRSPNLASRWKGWFEDQASLGPPCVPLKPGPAWWVGPVVASARKSMADQDVLAVLLTGRPARLFRWRIAELLHDKGLGFDLVRLNPGSDTARFKAETVAGLLDEHPAIQVVRVWDDDPENLRAIGAVVTGRGLTYNPVKINAAMVEVDCHPGVPPGPDMVWWGLFLDAASRRRLWAWWTKVIGEVDRRTQMDHMTVWHKGAMPLTDTEPAWGSVARIKVDGWASDGHNQAVRVQTDLPVVTDIPHVSVATDGSPSKLSAALIRSGVQPIDGPVLVGRIGWHDGTHAHYGPPSGVHPMRSANRRSLTMADNLRSKVIRLAHAEPDLRPHLLPLLAKQASRAFLPGKVPGTMVSFGIDHAVGRFVMVSRGSRTTLNLTDLDQAEAATLLKKHGKPGPALDAAVLAFSLDLDPADQ